MDTASAGSFGRYLRLAALTSEGLLHQAKAYMRVYGDKQASLNILRGGEVRFSNRSALALTRSRSMAYPARTILLTK